MKSIIIVGATSGIGYECLLQLARIAPNEQLILACRNKQSGEKAVREIKQQTDHKQIITMPLDLGSLQSIREFRDGFSKQPEPAIIALVNNAGVQIVSQTEYTSDGFEKTFGTNHVSLFYLTLLLLPFMDKKASITFTASSVHDPDQHTPVEPPVFNNAAELAHPKETGEPLKKVGLRRYSTSKLCNILTTYALQSRLSGTEIRVNAFDPGLVPGTRLGRSYSPLERFIGKYIFPFLRLISSKVNTAQNSGMRLANLAYADEYKNARGKYFQGIKEVKSSTDSYNKNYQDLLWSSTIDLIGIDQSEVDLPLK